MLEDFADLEIADEDTSLAREDRMRAAFEKSKANYAHEQVFTEPGWYDPPEIPPPTKLHVRNIDYSLNNLYLKRQYSQALDLALSQIEAEENNTFSEGREFQLVDLAIRCALKTGGSELAGQLADKTIRKWSSNVGLASTSAEAYLAASRPRDAVSAILTAISIRRPQMIYVPILYKSLESLSLSGELQNSEALESILSVITAYIRHRNTAGIEPQIIVDEATARSWLENCLITGVDQQKLFTLLCHKSDCDTDGMEGKSVRTL